ncbi:MAG: aminotransferase class I/II-fold pyridoxal phosphate-dependent enzyme [bacterium]|nr:aminotransferase class I/II-fold pyridoxal phosphate-dependent enzyme [bacterium]
MSQPGIISRDQLDDLSRQLGAGLGLSGSMILPFVDYTDLLTALLNHVGDTADRLIVGGLATPDVEMAAERAGLPVEELPGPTPFMGHAADVIPALKTGHEIVYLACPNWVTGADYSLQHLEAIADRVKSGILIVDEKYLDFYGISALPVLEKNAHVIIARSLTAGFGIRSDESGYLIGSPGLIGNFKETFAWTGISTTLYKIIVTTLANEEARTLRLTTVHDESLRLTTRLTRLGVQNRITATDFLLMRVADPARVGNLLAKHSAPIENLSGYPGLKNYVRYVIQSPLSNDRLLHAFSRMPAEYYTMDDIDKRAVMFHRPAEISVEAGPPEVINRMVGKNSKEGNLVGLDEL